MKTDIDFNVPSGVARNIGKHFTDGVIDSLLPWVILATIAFIALGWIYEGLGIEENDSDKSRWDRSGLVVHTDYKTGVEYLSDGHGGLTPRLSK